ncbi:MULTISPECIES: 3-hydroxyacyl-CoA dehydrogenase NAD-binding domain-containing protein [unclassified Dietzia]|uniref:3-hydroxyacyl-CoA dehydrogenase NAD-binding domain-containing protein n=1 Tax=unclassified Dietzia TaxID=2617939 RepID=UPI000D22978A|nr:MULTISPECIES: 3-hydroxyacyl-CoA dehydrogenase NAD-binding domain-containing protein [unclassified Dietzia]AVZ40877.1 3-hydroxyacyl-CoA dehydrogenase [Dietzia sp. JS16-p6b]QGW26504.1 FadB2 [Dietzia sp. DQ12-45-1b]
MSSEYTNTISYERDSDGVVVLTMDDPDQSANTMNANYLASMEAAVDRLEEEVDDITGVVLTSAKKSFFAGGDLGDILSIPADGADLAVDTVERAKAPLRRLETLGRPVVAAIGGAALGGGLEIALATHYRIVVDSPSIQLGLPEVSLGLLPGGGGIVRTVRMLGVVTALMEVLLEGRRLRPGKARELGLVDDLVASPDDLIPAAKAWIAANADDPVAATQPWDRKGYRMPGGTPSSPALAGNLPAFPAMLRKQLKGAPYPAPVAIMAAAVEGAGVDFAAASTIEARYFARLATGQTAKNMIRAFFFDLQKANGLAGKHGSADRAPVRKVVVLGAGMMGAAIAYVSAKAGMEVVLKDVDQAAAERGRGYSEKLVAKTVARAAEGPARDAAQAKGEALLARITPTTDPAAAAGAQAVIEAVFEDPEVKKTVFAEIAPHIAPDALLCSNTSTLPITMLAGGVDRPADFIGLHFFSPVDKMPLVEIIKGAETSEDALGRALALVAQIGKTPIVVNDSRGFFTSRVIGTFTSEGMAMLAEGVPAPTIEQASAQAGYPAPVLALMDELTLTLPRRIRDETREAAKAEGRELPDHPGNAVLDRMIDEFGRKGRSSGSGFYEYSDGKRGGLWPGLTDAFGGATEIPLQDAIDRMLFAEAIETVKCLDEGVLETTTDANVGSILGIGFPGWTGGVARYMDQYPGGLPGFVARAEQLAERYGDRFTPPESLRSKAASGGTYEEVHP